MKAGVFRNGYVLIYVTSDQRITAHANLRLLIGTHPVAGFKIRYSKAGDTVSHDGLTFSRVEGDFGYKAEAAVAAARRKIKQVSLATPPNGKSPTHVWLDELQHIADTKPVDVNKNGATFTLRGCGKRSARKHRKLGHKVTKISNTLYIWSK